LKRIFLILTLVALSICASANTVNRANRAHRAMSQDDCADCAYSADHYASAYEALCDVRGGTEEECQAIYNFRYQDYCIEHCSPCAACILQ